MLSFTVKTWRETTTDTFLVEKRVARIWIIFLLFFQYIIINELWHEISSNVVYTCSLIWAFACRLNIPWLLSYWLNTIWVSKLKRGLHRLNWVDTCQNATLVEITCHGSIFYSNMLRVNKTESLHQVIQTSVTLTCQIDLQEHIVFLL